ncbi:transcriptional regulator [Luteibacter sp. NPDC031894]|uniref:transcriptional regulator n=1 Tax=Luteibacter sp. NPDC031894 TaxID=3390572 RepID=UPI003D072622
MTTPLDRVIEILGSQEELAARLGIKSPSITGWRNRKRIPSERCIALEEVTGGQVTRYEMRPDVFGAGAPHAPAEQGTEESPRSVLRVEESSFDRRDVRNVGERGAVR